MAELLPHPQRVVGAFAVLATAGVVLGLVFWATGYATAVLFYHGMIYMMIAVGALSVGRQFIVAVIIGLASGAAVLSAGSPQLLVMAVAFACLAQAVFNSWHAAAAVSLPAIPAAWAESSAAAADPLQVGVVTFLGSLAAIMIGALFKMRGEPEPVDRRAAVWHAVVLALGCVAFVFVARAAGLTHIAWGVATLALLFLPSVDKDRPRVTTRILATTAGAALAAAAAILLPNIVCLALAAICGIITIAYVLTPDTAFLRIAFFTPTLLLFYGSGRFSSVLHLGQDRIIMTALGGLAAVALAALQATPAVVSRWHDAR